MFSTREESTMSHECEDCGETFDTLTRLRLHDCGESSDGMTDAEESWELSNLSDDRDASVPELDDALAAVPHDQSTVYHLLGVFESALNTALDKDDGGDTYRDVYWTYYEPVSDALDVAVQEEGWELLSTVADAYDPVTDEEVPLVAPAVQNAIGRNLIRTRVTADVTEIPPKALAYLADVIEYAIDADDTAREEAHAYGWGIGHPGHAVADTLVDAASDHPFWVHSAVEHAFYADQHAAVDLFERIVTEETVADSVRVPSGSLARYMLDCLAGPDSDEYWPTTPRYWDWHEELEYSFEWDDGVEARLRSLTEETNTVPDLSDNWTFQDLMV